jgi:hypothetical protein
MTDFKFGSNVDFDAKQLLNAVAHGLVADPGSPVAGQFWFRTDLSLFSFYDGAVVRRFTIYTAGDGLALTGADLSVNVDGSTLEISSDALRVKALGITNAHVSASAAIALSKLATDPLARANHTGTQLAATVSNFDTQVRTSRLDQMATPTASVAMGSQKITGLLDPTAAQDGATKAYVDALAQGVSWKDSVVAATTANITLSGTQTIDTVSVIAGDRVLVKDQTTTQDNGIYIVAAGAWTRAPDADTNADLQGATVSVDGGSQSGTLWNQVIDAIPLTIQLWVKIGTLADLVAGAGLTKTGNTVDVVALDGSITVAADTITVGLVPIAKGGTGATTAAGALSALGGAAAVSASVAGGAVRTVTHNLNTFWRGACHVSVVNETTFDEWHVGVNHTSANALTVDLTNLPGGTNYLVTVIGFV